MQYLTKRHRELIELLIQSNGVITTSDLAQHFSVSSRAVRYDLDVVAEWFTDRDTALERIPGKGVLLKANPIERRFLAEALAKMDKGRAVLSGHERELWLMLRLFQSNRPLTLEQLAEQLSVSKNTVLKDLNRLENDLQLKGLRLERKTNSGFFLKGDENTLRNAAVDTLRQLIDMDKFITTHRLSDSALPLGELFDSQLLRTAEAVVSMAEQLTGVSYSDNAIALLVLHIAVAIMRTQSNAPIRMAEEQKQQIMSLKDYSIAKEMAAHMQSTLDIFLSEDEVAYLALHVSSAKVAPGTIHGSYSLGEDDPEISNLVIRLVSMAENHLGVQLAGDYQLLVGLAYHLRIALHRLTNKMPIVNPLTQQMQFRFPLIFEVSRRIANELGNGLGVRINDDEVAYLAMHLGAAYERSMQSGYLARALVVCGAGIATAQMLISRLRGLLPELQLSGPVTLAEAKVLKSKEYDFVISTVDLQIEGINVVKVNPLIDDADLDLLKRMLFRFTSVKRLAVDSGPHGRLGYPNGGGELMLKDLITPDTIRLGVAAKNWEEAIRTAGGLLEESGGIQSSYTDAMINAVKNIGPYMVIMPGLALAHARPEDGVNSICMGLITLSEPVSFGRTQNDPVDIIIAFGAIDHTTHLRALSDLAKLLQLDENLEIIRNASSPEDIIDIIEKQC